MTQVREIDEKVGILDTLRRTSALRRPPVLIMAVVGWTGFVHVAIAGSSGTELQRGLTTVLIGRLITTRALTFFVLLTGCRFSHRRLAEA